MYDSGKIITGLIVFVLLITFPIWYNHGDAGEVLGIEVVEDAVHNARDNASNSTTSSGR